MLTLVLFAGCQMPPPASAPADDATAPSTMTENGETQPPNTVALPGDTEKSLPSEAPRNMEAEADEVNPAMGDMELLEQAYATQDASLCQRIQATQLQEICLENLSNVGGPDPAESDGEVEASYQEYGDTEEPEVNEEEQQN